MGLWPFLEAEMLKRGWRPAELARRAGFTQNRISHYASGGGADIKNARKLAQALGVHVLRVLYESGDLTPEELNGQFVVGQAVTLADIPSKELLAELDRRVDDNRHVM